jgi:UDP-2,4-diacetamido-2,4,6-trideoxy-beta-L-altropyranose hydrolase
MAAAALNQRIVFRADGGPEIGAGHLMRCLAVAQAWRDAGGEAVFACETISDALRRRLGEFEVIGARASSPDGLATSPPPWDAEWVVVDGYKFNAAYLEALAESYRVLVIDDLGALPRYSVEVIVNQNTLASDALYPSRNRDAVLLLGARYAVLRRELRDEPAPRDFERRGTKILVTLGQSVFKDSMAVILAGLEAIEGVEIQTLQNVENVRPLMEWADLAVSAAGSTCWELARLGCPMVITVVAENQRRSAQGLTQAGAAVTLPDLRELTAAEVTRVVGALVDDAATRERLSNAGRALVDGRGTARVIARLERPRLRLRNATQEDCELVFGWTNDPVVRAASFSSEPVAWEDHCRWYERRMSDAGTLLLIAHDCNGTPVGQVRFQAESAESTVSISLGAAGRGRGMAAGIIDVGTSILFAERAEVDVVHAYIRQGNEASVKAFVKADFQLCAPGTHHPDALHFIRRR